MSSYADIIAHRDSIKSLSQLAPIAESLGYGHEWSQAIDQATWRVTERAATVAARYAANGATGRPGRDSDIRRVSLCLANAANEAVQAIYRKKSTDSEGRHIKMCQIHASEALAGWERLTLADEGV